MTIIVEKIYSSFGKASKIRVDSGKPTIAVGQFIQRSSQSAHNVLISPKVGTQFNFSKHIGLFMQAQYHFSAQKTKEQFVGYTGLGEPITISPIQKFFSADAGLVVSF